MWESTAVVGSADLGGSYGGERWSYHLARPPAWLQSAEPSVIQWFHDQVYNRPDLDPNATILSIEDEYRRESARLGVRADATSANVLLAYARLQLGLITWQQIANEAGTLAPTGAGALEAPILDVIASREQAAIDTLRQSGAEIDSTDANVLALLQSAGANFSAGIVQPFALSPVPAPQERISQALGQGSPAVASPYSGLSSFEGFGPGGNYATMAPVRAVSSPRGISPLILLAVAGVVAYLVMRKS